MFISLVVTNKVATFVSTKTVNNTVMETIGEFKNDYEVRKSNEDFTKKELAQNLKKSDACYSPKVVDKSKLSKLIKYGLDVPYFNKLMDNSNNAGFMFFTNFIVKLYTYKFLKDIEWDDIDTIEKYAKDFNNIFRTYRTDSYTSKISDFLQSKQDVSFNPRQGFSYD